MYVVTIDGPAGAGKSTVSRLLAGRLGWRLLDTGAMYRAVAYAAVSAGLDLNDVDALGSLAERLSVELPPGRVMLNGEDVAGVIRSREVTRATRFVADAVGVRRRMVELQREFAAENHVVTEGRDQGTVVFPDAFCKFFVTASPEERARRRHAELLACGDTISYEAVLRDQTERDASDASRAIAPMTPADDAETVDTTGQNLDEVLHRLEDAVRERMGRVGVRT